jgi:hypothetical protein
VQELSNCLRRQWVERQELDFTAPSPDNEEARQRWNVVSALNCADQQHRQIIQTRD